MFLHPKHGFGKKLHMSKNINFLLAISPEDGQAHFWRCVRAASLLANKQNTSVGIYLPQNDIAKAAVSKFINSDPSSPIHFHFLNDMTPPPSGKIHFTPFDFNVLGMVPTSTDVLILDTYRVMEEPLLRYAERRAKHVILIDDYDIKGIKGAHAATVFNMSLTGTSINYPSTTTVLTAPDYHLIQEEMFGNRKVKPNSVFVSFSAADRGHIAYKFFSNLLEVSPYFAYGPNHFTAYIGNNDLKSAFDRLKARYRGKLTLIDSYDDQSVPGQYEIHIGNPGGLTNKFICSENAKIAGIAALSEISPNLEAAFKGPGIPFADLTGILDGKNRDKEMMQFARVVTSCLIRNSGITVARPNPKGMQNFCNYVISKCG